MQSRVSESVKMRPCDHARAGYYVHACVEPWIRLSPSAYHLGISRIVSHRSMRTKLHHILHYVLVIIRAVAYTGLVNSVRREIWVASQMFLICQGDIIVVLLLQLRLTLKVNFGKLDVGFDKRVSILDIVTQ